MRVQSSLVPPVEKSRICASMIVKSQWILRLSVVSELCRKLLLHLPVVIPVWISESALIEATLVRAWVEGDTIRVGWERVIAQRWGRGANSILRIVGSGLDGGER